MRRVFFARAIPTTIEAGTTDMNTPNNPLKKPRYFVPIAAALSLGAAGLAAVTIGAIW